MKQYVAKQVKECFELISLFLSMILPEYPLMTLEFLQPVTQIFMLRSKEVF